MERNDILKILNEYNLTEQQYDECLKLIRQKKNNQIDIDWQEIVSRYNLPMSVDTLRRNLSSIFGGSFVADYLEMNKADNTNLYEQTSINKDGSCTSNKLIEMNSTQSKDKNYILKAHGFDINTWELVSAKNSQWHQNSKKNGLSTLYSSNITVRPIQNHDLTIEMLDSFFNKIKVNHKPIKYNKNYLNGDKLLLLDIADLHFNLQASLFTTGNEYNCDIAEELFMNVINDVLSRTKTYDFNKIVLCISGDMLNADNIQGTTTKGTPQDNELSYYDACERMYQMVINAIDLLKQIAKVDVLYVMGNHDEVTGYKLAKFVQAWYKNDKMVEVDYSPLPRKYKVFGKTLLCFMHDGKIKDIPALISNEAREYWSQVDNVEVFLQHLHTEQVLMENHNIRIQRLPTISAKSKWTNDSGYGSKRQCKSFIFDKEDGLTDVLYTKI